MNTEAAVSGAISIVILVLATLKRSGLLDKAWEVLKERLKRRKTSDAKDVKDPRKEVEPSAPPVSELQMYLDRLDRERARLDAELETVQQFLKKKEKVRESG